MLIIRFRFVGYKVDNSELTLEKVWNFDVTKFKNPNLLHKDE